jgi:hypothetical protein
MFCISKRRCEFSGAGLTDTHTHTRTHVHAHTHARTHMRTQARTHAHARTHTRAHTHTHAHTRTHAHRARQRHIKLYGGKLRAAMKCLGGEWPYNSRLLLRPWINWKAPLMPGQNLWGSQHKNAVIFKIVSLLGNTWDFSCCLKSNRRN